MKITRTHTTTFSILSESGHTYTVAAGARRWTCSCPARGECKHLRAARGCTGLGVGDSIELAAPSRPVAQASDDEEDIRGYAGEEPDFGDPDHGDDEVAAARRGRAAYRRFLGY